MTCGSGGPRLHVVDVAPARSTLLPPVVLVPALLTTTSALGEIADRASDRRVVVLDLRSHGGSDDASVDVSLDDLAGDVLGVMDRLGIARAVLGGLSLGALVALHAARRAPARTSALCLMGAPCSPETAVTRAGRLATYDAMERLGVAPVLRAMSAWMFGRATRRDHPARVEAWVDSMRDASPAAVRRTAMAALERGDAREVARAIRAPALVLAGAEDVIAPVAESVALSAAFPRAEHHVLEGAGHTMTLERGDEVARLLTGWLERVRCNDEGDSNALIPRT